MKERDVAAFMIGVGAVAGFMAVGLAIVQVAHETACERKHEVSHCEWTRNPYTPASSQETNDD